jgi:hypothetical protein
MAKAKVVEKDIEIILTEIKQQAMEVCVEGISPLVCHRLSEAARRELLLPGRKKNRAEREGSTKHDPIAEYRESFYLSRNPESETLLVMPASAFKGAMCTAALDVPGAAKAQIGRLVHIEETEVAIYGTPEVFITEVRNSGMNRTPDMRTRPILPEWAAKFTVRFTVPLLNAHAIAQLIGSSGQIAGVGDGRPEKGKLAFGRFNVITKERFATLKKSLGSKQEQGLAFAQPRAYDEDTRKLLEWFEAEASRRGFKVA